MLLDLVKYKDKPIHFIGIGGISMSGLAEILLEKGYIVSGSDMNKSNITDKLQSMGAKVYIGHESKNVEHAGLVVYTAAISEDNPELIKTKELNIPLMDRAEFLGKLMKGHKYNIAISGTHGKTTTTSMITHICLKADLDPTILVGGDLDIINGNVRTGKSEYFITEACEYKASFLKFYPYIGTILNIDADHLDYYKDIQDIQDTFVKFAKLIPKEGYLVAYAEDPHIEPVLKACNSNILTYGIDKGDIIAKNITYNEKACASFDVFQNENKLFSVNLNVPGKHNLLNSLSSICIALILDISLENIKLGIESFGGTHRRFELKGTKNGITIIDDYAHHPTEIKATLKAAKNYPHNKVVCIFQPHTYSRTITLFNEFTECFYDADEIILADIYAAREKDTGIINSTMLGDALRLKNLNCKNFHSFEEILNYLNSSLNEGDLVLTVGAGDVYKIGEDFLNK